MPRVLSVVGYCIALLAFAVLQLSSSVHYASANAVHEVTAASASASASAFVRHEAHVSSNSNGDSAADLAAGLAALATHDYGFMVGLQYDRQLQQQLYEIDMLGNVVLKPASNPAQAEPMLERTPLDFPDAADCKPGGTKFGINYRKPWQMIAQCNNNNVTVGGIKGAEYAQAYQLDALSPGNAEPKFRLRPNGEALLTPRQSFTSIAAGVYQGQNVFFAVGGGFSDVAKTVFVGSADGTGTIAARLNTTQAANDAGMQQVYSVAYLETPQAQYVYINDVFTATVLQVNVNNVSDVIAFASSALGGGTSLAIDATGRTSPRLVVIGDTADYLSTTIDVVSVPVTSSVVQPVSSRSYSSFGLYADTVSIAPLALPLSGTYRTLYRTAQTLQPAAVRVEAETVVLLAAQARASQRGQSTLVITGYDTATYAQRIYTFVIDTNGQLPASETVFVSNATLPNGRTIGIAMYNRGEDFSTKN